MSFWGSRRLKTQNKPISKISLIFGKYPKVFFSFLFNIIFYYGISKQTIGMPFRGLTMLKSPKLTMKRGLCYGFAMVAPGPEVSPFSRVAGLLKQR